MNDVRHNSHNKKAYNHYNNIHIYVYTITRSIQKYTGIFAISVNGVVGWDLYEKSGINTYRLIEFLEKFIT